METSDDSSSSLEIENPTTTSLNENKESLDKSLRHLKKWVEENKNLHIRNEDKYIVIFLRCCKYDLAKTKKKIEDFYRMKKTRHQLFTNRDPFSAEVQGLIKMGTFFVLKNPQGNCPVVIIRPSIRDPSIYNMDQVLKSGSMVMDVLAMEDELAQLYGIITVVDLTNTGLSNVTELSVSRLKDMVSVWQNYYCRPQKILFINVPAYINVFLKMVKSFMTAKMRGRVEVNRGSDALTEVLDKKILPPEYGGEGETIEELSCYWANKLTSYFQWFKEDEKFKAI
ncbi:retinol-binding protein pinta-like [Coccinella septempunctata]|uniref:retinol-binding protein pinta-like n=1 Tax=Coccinella septempunctata TaxID=41139 RepID=UPI001D091C44|nr:retinol-binding protein pinta-like [Coccinella septempunctata]